MSLTSQLREDGPLKTWMMLVTNMRVLGETVHKHNEDMRRAPRKIKPQGSIYYPKGGMAFTYGFRSWLHQGQLCDWLPDTVAWLGLRACMLDGAFIHRYNEELTSVGAVLLVEFDAAARSLKYFTTLDEPMSPADPKYQETIRDVGNLMADIPEALRGIEGLQGERIIPNPTFKGSVLVGGADAQMIVGTTLLDVRTTLHKRPITLSNLLQQLGYVLLDFDDQYGLTHMAWYYSRQRVFFRYPIAHFIPNLEDLRERLAIFLMDQFEDAINLRDA